MSNHAAFIEQFTNQRRKKKKQASSIYDRTYAWHDNILTAAASLALPSYGSHYSGVSRVA
jgi:hypothetical protein